MTHPFHLSFVVPDLKAAERFYTNCLDCQKGRDSGDWIDILFFGHQLTLHQATDDKPAQAIDHFGVILNKGEWMKVLNNMESYDIKFILAPRETALKDNSRAGKFIINDPAGNCLEFKYYTQPSAISHQPSAISHQPSAIIG